MAELRIAVLLALSALDASLTVAAISSGHATEVNPALAYAFVEWGIFTTVIIKLAVTLLGAIMIEHANHKRGWLASTGCIGVYVGVVTWQLCHLVAL